jgi:hypothetical protein
VAPRKDQHAVPDANPLPDHDYGAMTDRRHRVHLDLDLDPEADPIAGLVHDGAAEGRPFSGWMDLTRTIELSLAAARGADATGPAEPAERENKKTRP